MKPLSSIKELLLATVRIYRQKHWEFIEVCLLALLGAFPLVLIYVIYYFVNYNNQLGQYETLNFVLAILYFVATLVAAYFALSTVIGCCLVANDDKRTSAWQIILATRHYFWHFLLVWLMFELVVILCGLPLIIACKLLGGDWWSILLSGGKVLNFWLGAWVAVFVLPMLWALLSYGWSFFALMEDGFQNISALRRSRELVKTNFWPLLFRLMAFFAVWLVFYSLITVHLYWPSSSWFYSLWSILMKLLLIFSNFVFVPSLVIFGRLLYKELVVANPKTKLARAGSSILVKVAIAIGALFLLASLVNTVYGMSSTSIASKKMAQRDWQRVQDIKSMQAALAAYRQEQGTYPEWLVMGQPLSAADKVYLSQLPSNIKSADGDCPVDYEYTYDQVASGQDYVLKYCLGVGFNVDNSSLLSAGEHSVSQDDLIFN